MSGGVGPTGSDITLPDEHEVVHKEDQDPNFFPKKPHYPSTTGTASPIKATLLSFPHLNSLATIIILASSGLVSLEDFSFTLFSLVYVFFLSKVTFPLKPTTHYPSIFNPKNKLLRLYVTIGAIVGLYAPIAYILEGTYVGDKEGIKAASPHLFLLASQVFMEGIVFRGRFSLPTRAFVPVFYNSRRIFTIVDWLRTEIYKAEAEHSGYRRVLVGRALAVANMAFWCYNLFGFLVPVYLPRVFKMYYSGNKEKE